MMKKNSITVFLTMHLGFLLYSFYTVTGKIASRYEFLSLSFCLFYILLIGILFIYAVLWQQILKTIRLSFATANKAISIVWGMLWSLLFFNEEITFKKITGAIIIILGIIILSATSLTENKNE